MVLLREYRGIWNRLLHRGHIRGVLLCCDTFLISRGCETLPHFRTTGWDMCKCGLWVYYTMERQLVWERSSDLWRRENGKNRG